MQSEAVQLHTWGDYALFTRPELKSERMSYDVMTPAAARGILEAIHWKPAITWMVEGITVLRPIRFQAVMRNEVSEVISAVTARRKMTGQRTGELDMTVEDVRTQRGALFLRDVAYTITARMRLTGRSPGDTIEKHLEIFTKRARSGRCFHRPYLGTRECAAHFELIEGQEPESGLPPIERDKDLGLMFYDFDYGTGSRYARFFRARIAGGRIDVPQPDSPHIHG